MATGQGELEQLLCRIGGNGAHPVKPRSYAMSNSRAKVSVFGALLWASLLCCGPVDTVAQETKIRAAYSALSGSMAWVWTAQEGRHFDRHGLKVDLVYIGGTAQLFQAMLAGEVAFGVGGGPSIINANLQRPSIVGVAGTLNRMIMKIMASPRIKTAADVRGKRIAVTRYGTITDFSARLFLKRWGLSPEKDTAIIQVGSIPNVLASLQSGASQIG
ncbi:MAG TPA: ABC transporter substrate-binding protein, partial [Candidatus Eisenbacteria bacterium]|nr:ABC transporter substrate-binding protein [Candidatus Eisenbacteria bacterium]